MSNAQLVKIEAGTAAEICARFLASKETLALLEDAMGPGPFLKALMANKQYVAGIDFLAHALPPREAVWWGCLCFQHACGNAMSPPDKGAVTAAVHWVLQPGDATRGAAKVQGEAAGLASVAGALAMAAYLAGPGFAATPGGPAIPAPPFGTAKSVANAVKIACTKSDPVRIVQTQKSFMELGIGVAAGRFM